jgi:hypothetical protein
MRERGRYKKNKRLRGKRKKRRRGNRSMKEQIEYKYENEN